MSTYGHSPASGFSASVKPHETSVLATTRWRTTSARTAIASTGSQRPSEAVNVAAKRVRLRHAPSPATTLTSHRPACEVLRAERQPGEATLDAAGERRGARQEQE